MEKTSTFFRSSTNKVVAGVCGGLAEKLVIDPVIVRLIFVLLAVFGGGGILAYIILWIVLPERPWSDAYASKSRETSSESNGENQSWQPQDAYYKETQVPDPNASKTQLIAGTILIALGGLFLVAAFIPRINVYDLWPVALIVIGLFILRPTTKF
jgi:phage shock protein C